MKKTSTTGKINVQARMPDSLVREFDRDCDRLGLDRQRVLIMAVVAWLGLKDDAKVKAFSDSLGWLQTEN